MITSNNFCFFQPKYVNLNLPDVKHPARSGIPKNTSVVCVDPKLFQERVFPPSKPIDKITQTDLKHEVFNKTMCFLDFQTRLSVIDLSDSKTHRLVCNLWCNFYEEIMV